jgi:LacI family transcriptional regulator
MKIKSEDVARIANVSRSTVSRVINNYSNVPQETREKVMKVIEEYGYIPHNSARVLAGKSNNVIGLFIADIKSISVKEKKWIGTHSPYFLNLISEIISESKKYGYMVLVNVITDINEYEQIEHLFINGMISGGIFVGSQYQVNKINDLIDKGYNMVLIDEKSDISDYKNVSLINTENIKGAYEMTKYLIDCGHTKIAHVIGDSRLSSLERKNGYEKAMEDSGLIVKEEYLIDGQYSESLAYNQVIKLFKKEEVTAIFAANDIMALGVIKALNQLNKKVPDDVSVVGFDNLQFTKYLEVPLTTMEVSLSEIAKYALKAISDQKLKNRKFTCPVKMIKRGSVKKIKK